ncbi:hypothetical protein [Rhizobium ruizarguesonis]|uniref:hypothetical protein n=1 Tax=Rhizobium ruizarguesonis TaxID=2081791 RepID=UPI00102FC894|nr:hypothetical protein [Rhizobium ruizarguesonis]TBE99663.1 hypothetical protein ELG98_25315 [Rhizobium ruizarguesonis]
MTITTTTASAANTGAAMSAPSRASGRRVDARLEPPALRRHPHLVRYSHVEADFNVLIDKAIAAINDGEPVEDEILGRYINLASMVRAVSFREGKLLEQAFERLSKQNPDLVVLVQSLKLPLVKTAVEAVTGNDWTHLDGVRLDSEAPAKGYYTPDVILVNRARHLAFILDLKRSLASYGDTTRLEELKLKMLASAMILPDWLYKNHKRLMVDNVGVAIVDGASRPSDHASGVWALNDIDDLLEIDGAAACMAELRVRFGRRVQTLLEDEARRALGVIDRPIAPSEAVAPRFRLRQGDRQSTLGVARARQGTRGGLAPDGSEILIPDDLLGEAEGLADEEDDGRPAARIRVGFARRLLAA